MDSQKTGVGHHDEAGFMGPPARTRCRHGIGLDSGLAEASMLSVPSQSTSA
jgi:hypothetical protein